MGALLALIPGKDLIYGGLIVALLLFGIHEVNHLKAEGAAHEVAALKVSSDKLIAQEAAHVALVANAYAASAAKTTETLDEQTQATAAAQSTAAQRLSDFNAYRRSHPTVASAGGAGGSAGQGTNGGGSDSERLSSLEQVALDLAGATAAGHNALSACMADRDALTGKP